MFSFNLFWLKLFTIMLDPFDSPHCNATFKDSRRKLVFRGPFNVLELNSFIMIDSWALPELGSSCACERWTVLLDFQPRRLFPMHFQGHLVANKHLHGSCSPHKNLLVFFASTLDAFPPARTVATQFIIQFNIRLKKHRITIYYCSQWISPSQTYEIKERKHTLCGHQIREEMVHLIWRAFVFMWLLAVDYPHTLSSYYYYYYYCFTMSCTYDHN